MSSIHRMRNHRLGVTVVAVGLVGTVALLSWQRDRHASSAQTLTDPTPTEIHAQAVREAPARAVPTMQDADSAEGSLMKKLHELGETDPRASLELAIEGNARFPASADAPERGWIICKSLVNMQRFQEAVAEARLVVEQYPSTPWALDVERHLLINPMSDPSERGYGKKYELE